MYEWDKGAENRLYALQKQYKDAIPVFGGAVFATTAAKMGDMDAFVEYLMNVVTHPSFRRYPNGVESALNTFCNLCLVDPKLVELHMEMTFAEIEDCIIV